MSFKGISDQGKPPEKFEVKYLKNGMSNEIYLHGVIKVE